MFHYYRRCVKNTPKTYVTVCLEMYIIVILLQQSEHAKGKSVLLATCSATGGRWEVKKLHAIIQWNNAFLCISSIHGGAIKPAPSYKLYFVFYFFHFDSDRYYINILTKNVQNFLVNLGLNSALIQHCSGAFLSAQPVDSSKQHRQPVVDPLEIDSRGVRRSCVRRAPSSCSRRYSLAEYCEPNIILFLQRPK